MMRRGRVDGIGTIERSQSPFAISGLPDNCSANGVLPVASLNESRFEGRIASMEALGPCSVGLFTLASTFIRTPKSSFRKHQTWTLAQIASSVSWYQI